MKPAPKMLPGKVAASSPLVHSSETHKQTQLQEVAGLSKGLAVDMELVRLQRHTPAYYHTTTPSNCCVQEGATVSWVMQPGA